MKGLKLTYTKNSLFRVIIVFVAFALGLAIMYSCQNKSKNKVEKEIEKEDFPELSEKIRNNPEDASLYNQRAKLFLEKNETSKALTDINQAMKLEPENPDFFMTLSDIYMQMGKVKPTEDALLKAHEFAPKNLEVMLKLAELKFFFKEYTETFKWLSEVLAIDENNAQAYFMRAFALKEKGDTTNAVKNFLISTEKDPEFYDAYIQLGILYAIRKNPLAVDYYQNALNIRPESKEAHYNLAMFYQETQKLNKAMEVYNNLIQIDPGYKYPYFNMGYINLEYLRVYDIARDYFSKAIECDPDYFEAYFNRGLCHEKLGDFKNARQDYQKALQLKSNYSPAIDGLNRLDEKQK